MLKARPPAWRAAPSPGPCRRPSAAPLAPPSTPSTHPARQVRELKTSNDSLVLLKTALGAGHYADSGIEARLREMAYK